MVSVLPSCTRTVVAVSGGASPIPGVTPGVWLSAWKPDWSEFRSSSVSCCQSRALGPRLINIMYFIASSSLGMVALKDERVERKSTPSDGG